MESDLCPSGKLSWPELNGMKGEEAAKIIKEENPRVNPIVWDKPWIPLNYDCYRVFVIVDSDGIVIRPPMAG
ncbi:hypothetical protein SOVF_047380 [Spinacia oleracea]|nr:hypothetical protein SOVF_047380 [Spinacia oleracea]